MRAHFWILKVDPLVTDANAFENFTDNWKEGYWSKDSNVTFVGFFRNGDHFK